MAAGGLRRRLNAKLAGEAGPHHRRRRHRHRRHRHHVSAMTPDTYSVVPKLDGAIRWLNNYCKQTPLSNFETDLQALVDQAYPSRQQKAPRPVKTDSINK
jgi:hypothetical protein